MDGWILGMLAGPMKKPTNSSARALFEEALRLSPAERGSFLDRACRNDPSTRARVAALLNADEEAGSFLERLTLSAPGATTTTHAPGDCIGDYRLIERAGEGGIGVVWRAEQLHPIQRTVAIKVIKLGMDTPGVIARFEAERQALALMDHPGVARVFEAGATEAGRPFFAMEFVEGVPITDYCEENSLSLEARLELFVLVCRAIEHAHVKGLVHRDLKPSNVLVRTVDGEPRPKVIDFGIAKATHARLTEHTLATEHGQLLGTPRYMSPEQADLQEVDIDTRTDVYALGALLYEMLTGRPVLESSGTGMAGYMELLRAVREEEPRRPSSLDESLRGDLDTILLKALAKEREERYGSARELAAEVIRHLRHEPIEATPPTALYQLRKLAQRHRTLFVAAAVTFSILVVATTVSVILAVSASNARDDAQDKTEELSDARDDLQTRAEELEVARNELQSSNEELAAARDAAEDRAAELEEEQARTQRVVEFQYRALQDLDAAAMGAQIVQEFLQRARRHGVPESSLAQLSGAVNGADLARSVVDQQILQRTVASIHKRFGDEPAVAAELEASVSGVYRQLGMQAEALPHMRRAYELNEEAFGPGHEETLKTYSNTGLLLAELGRMDEARPYYYGMNERCMEFLGPDHELTAISLHALAWLAIQDGRVEEARELNLEVAERFLDVFGPEDPKTIVALGNAGVAEHEAGNYERALELVRTAWQGSVSVSGRSDTVTVAYHQSLTTILLDVDRLDEAYDLQSELVGVLEEDLGLEHPLTYAALAKLGVLEASRGNLDDALVILQDASSGLDRTLGKTSDDALDARNSLVSILHELGAVDEALEIAEETLILEERVLGAEHKTRAATLVHTGVVLGALGRREEAISRLEEALSIRRRAFGERHTRVAIVLADLGVQYVALNRLNDARAALEEALSIHEESRGPYSSHVATTLRQLAQLAEAEGTLERSGQLLDRCASILERLPSRDPVELGHVRVMQGSVARRLNRFERAEESLLSAGRILEDRLAPSHPHAHRLREELATLYVSWYEVTPTETLQIKLNEARAAVER